MISRREFLKIGGLAAAAFSGGFGLQRLLENNAVKRFSLAALLPADEYSLKTAVNLFYQKVKLDASNVIVEGGGYNKALKEIIGKSASGLARANGTIRFKLTPLEQNSRGDIMLSDEEKIIYSPDKFDREVSVFRSYLNDKDARMMLTAELKESDRFSFADERYAVIENGSGIVDKIRLNSGYNDINISGSSGRLTARIADSRIYFTHAPCRHKICTRMSAAHHPGDFIACVPGRVIIKIESV